MIVRVLVASEVRLYRDALQRVLRDAEGIVLAGIATSAEEVVKQACRLSPVVVVMGMAMAESFGDAKHARSANIGGVAVLGIPEIPADVVACLPSGILGFVTRDGTTSVLLDAIRVAGRGEAYCSHAAPHKSQRVASESAASLGSGSIAELTAREMEILRLMQHGVSNKTISSRLGIEPSTVKNHVHSILAKLGVHRRGEAISLLYQQEYSERGWGETLPHDSPGDDLAPQAALA